MSDEETTGGCHCGAIRYRVTGPPKFSFLCHCDNCRKLNGGARLSAVSFPKGGFTVEGTPTVYRYAGGKDEIAASFCGACGTPIFAAPAAYPGVVVVRINSLDDQNAAPPRKSVYEDQACVWDKTL